MSCLFDLRLPPLKPRSVRLPSWRWEAMSKWPWCPLKGLLGVPTASTGRMPWVMGLQWYFYEPGWEASVCWRGDWQKSMKVLGKCLSFFILTLRTRIVLSLHFGPVDCCIFSLRIVYVVEWLGALGVREKIFCFGGKNIRDSCVKSVYNVPPC